MGYREGVLAGFLLDAAAAVCRSAQSRFVSGPDGMMQIFPDLVRIPDVAFASWPRFPEGRLPTNQFRI